MLSHCFSKVQPLLPANLDFAVHPAESRTKPSPLSLSLSLSLSLFSMELPSMKYACDPHSSSSYHFSASISKPFPLRILPPSVNLKASHPPCLKAMAQAFENEAAARSSQTVNEQQRRPGGKDRDTEVNGKAANHVNGAAAAHLANQAFNMKNSACVGSNVELEARLREAATATVRDESSNGYLKLMQGLYTQTHQPSAPVPPHSGLGIVEFLRGKKIMITGATGFLAKVLVEKILRVQPDIGHLFLLIKGQDASHVKSRMQHEIVQATLFKNLQSIHGSSYQNFMESKISTIIGNLGEDNLGMDPNVATKIQGEVDIIINSAASTTFDERYDHALNLNTKGAQRVTKFANHCPKLQLLMHVSTAFVNGERKGIVKERSFKIGCSIANELSNNGQVMVPDIDVDKELELVRKKLDEVLHGKKRDHNMESSALEEKHIEKDVHQAMKDIGMERAKKYGWQDTYVFTKALGEMLVDSTRGQTPVVIIRPSVVESSFKDPFPGWMEGNRMMDPIIISYGKGQLPGFLVDPKSVLDVVPVDMVANAMLAAMARHANNPGLEVYQVASSVLNPLVFSELARMSREHFEEHPFVDKFGKPLPIAKLQLFDTMDGFMDAVTTCPQVLQVNEKGSTSSPLNEKWIYRHKQLTLKVKEQAAYLANLYRPYTFYGGRFDTTKTLQLLASLSPEEKEVFGFDVDEIDWDAYIKTIHIPGLRKHVLKGRGSNM